MPRPAAVFGTVVVLALGFSLGRCGSDDTETITETKFVKVPVVKTHVVTKEVYGKLPQSCIDAAEEVQTIMAEDEKQTEAAGDLLLLAEDLATATAFTDINTVNKLIEGIREERDILNETVVNRAESVKRFNTLMSACETEVNE